MVFIKRVSISEPYFRSGRQVRFFFNGLRILLRALITVTRARSATLLETAGVQLAADDGVLDADILHSATAKHHDRVFLQIVPLARDVGCHFHAVG